jgi:ATP-dependent RNA helicase SUPV3L1/SUV3
MADKLLRDAHGVRAANGNQFFALDPAKAVSTGLKPESYAVLLRLAGFRSVVPRRLAKDAHGPPAPSRWRWRSPYLREPVRQRPATVVPAGSPFAALAALVS